MRLLRRRAKGTRSEEKAPEPFAEQCGRVRTRAGRKAHLQEPGNGLSVLCGWMTPHWHPAEPGLEECLPCKAEALAEDKRRKR